jgi:hypothetical protein
LNKQYAVVFRLILLNPGWNKFFTVHIILTSI